MTRRFKVATPPPQQWANHITEVVRAMILEPAGFRDPIPLFIINENGDPSILKVVIKIIDIESQLVFGYTTEGEETVSVNITVDEHGHLIVTLP
jgi:hypothetical protein